MEGPIKTRNDVTAALQRNRERLQSSGVRRVGLFGTFVRGEPGPSGDIDLLVEFVRERKTFDSFMMLCCFLEDLFGREITVVTPESPSPHIGPHVAKEVEYVSLAA